LPFFHFDFYRLRHPNEALALGLDEYLAAGGLTIIEWADKFPELLPAGTLWLDFAAAGENAREIRRR
jgi:tRNA threonylcarbamoyladenosine biosynthesis protein TsaE